METKNLPRIGIYGGSFDPIHYGHIEVAKAAFTEMALNRLLFVPTVTPPHKSNDTPYVHRLGMLREALREEGEPGFNISTIEEDLPFPSYSINTIKALFQQHNGVYFFVLGVDAFLDITTWKAYEKVLSLVNLVISPRKGYSVKELEQTLIDLGYHEVSDGWSHPVMKKIFVLSTVPSLVSSSEIRAVLQSGAVIEGVAQTLLIPAVLSYIQKNRLYNETL